MTSFAEDISLKKRPAAQSLSGVDAGDSLHPSAPTHSTSIPIMRASLQRMLAGRIRSRRLIVLLTTGLFLTLGILLVVRSPTATSHLSRIVHKGPPRPPSPVHASPQREARALAAAGNATLGFSKIAFINMKQRWDRVDAAVLQSYVSGLKITQVPAVEGKADIPDSRAAGMPPGSGRQLSSGQAACYRSHANIWAELAEERGPPILILEADAAWDANLRGIMTLANRHFVEYLSEIPLVPRQAPFYDADGGLSDRPAQKVQFDPDDPWLSEHWDIISLGHCNDQTSWYKLYGDKVYEDPWVIHDVGKSLFDMPSGTTRRIRRSSGYACTTAYAVSHRGAAKLLLGHAVDLNEALDLKMGQMIRSGQIISFTMNPPPIVQWVYEDGIGKAGGADSDIHREDNGENKDKDGNEDNDQKAWDRVHWRMSAWKFSEKFGGLKFKQGALDIAWERLMGEGSAFQMPEVPGMPRIKAVSPPENKSNEEKKEEDEVERQGGAQTDGAVL